MIEKIARIYDEETGEELIYIRLRNGHGDAYQLVLCDTPEYGMEYIKFTLMDDASRINPLLVQDDIAELDYERMVAA